MRKPLIALLTVVFSSGAAYADGGLFGNDCSHTSPRNASTSAAGVTRVIVHAQAGTLKIDGQTGDSSVAVRGTACSSDEDFVRSINFRMRKSGTDLIVETDIPERNSIEFGWFQARLDLAILVPAGVKLVVRDGSGATSIANVGPTEIEDGSGELQVRHVAGDLRIDDGSGAVTIDDVRGNVRLEDGSGGIDIRNVTGSVEVDDNSGGMDIQQIGGSVTVLDDSSGGITIRGVKQNVVIEDDGSGGVDVKDVGGDFTVRRKGSGGVDYARVSGRVSVPRD
ncbi:MAG TPA: hypothetical protein VGF69_12920 [Thermoanaerobaculia bacterium]|jgi:hypothetical protein